MHRGDPRWRWLATAVIAVSVALRFVHLGADVPSDLSPESAGVYVDEGYKTLSPRNLVLFGTTHWNPRDDYTGWMATSPLTQWPHYFLFRLLGPTLETARIFPIACFALFLVAYVWGLGRRYSPALLLGGALLLALEPTLYFFSRTALFETPLILALYGTLFALAKVDSRGLLRTLPLVVSIAAIAVLGIKRSALVYFIPLVGAILWVASTRGDAQARSRLYLYRAGAGAAFVLACLLAFTYGTWGPRIGFAPLKFLSRVFDNPTARVSFPTVLAGLLCAIHVAAARPHALRDAYFASLVAIAIGGSLLLALFPYDPLRYYVPILPAYVLLVLEWIRERAWRSDPVGPPVSATAAAVVALIGLWWLLLHTAVGYLVAGKPLLQLRFAVPIAAGLAALIWHFRSPMLSGRAIAAALVAALAVFAVHTSATLGEFAWDPSYDARSVRAELAMRVPEGSSIGGDWAPFFALGTSIPTLYMTTTVNPIDRILEIRPDFFLYSETLGPNLAIAALRNAKGVKVGEPLFERRYNGSAILLYPLEYDAPLPAKAP